MRYKKIVPSKPHTTLSRVTCDRCGNDIDNRGWTEDDIELSAKLGEIYPEVDTRSLEETHCCPSCWPAVRGALEGLGFKFRVGHVDDGYLDDAPWDPKVPPSERGP